MAISLILLVALIIDLVLGEPPRIIHPVVWMGKVASSLERGNVSRSPLAQLVYGAGIVLITIGLFTAATSI